MERTKHKTTGAHGRLTNRSTRPSCQVYPVTDPGYRSGQKHSNKPYPILSMDAVKIEERDMYTSSKTRLFAGQGQTNQSIPDYKSASETSWPDGEKDGEKDDSIKDMLVDFSKETTAHGLVHITSAKSSLTRSTWLAIVLGASSFMLLQMTLLLFQYFEYNVSVTVALVSEKALEFPSVTVCNTNKLRRSAVRDSNYSEMLMLESNFVPPYYVPCLAGDFLCQSGKHCIKPYLVCDGVNHCGDMSDERQCNYHDCGDNQFRCVSGSELGICISNDLLCDKISHCYGGEDEDNCGECDSGYFQCLVSHECIKSLKTCDMNFDCRDGSDESITVCDHELEDVARGKFAAQTGRNYKEGGPKFAVDGDNETCAESENHWEPFWAVDLGKTYLVYEIRIMHRQVWRLRRSGLEIRVGPNWMSLDNAICATGIEGHEVQVSMFTVRCSPTAVAGRYLTIQVKDNSESMRLCEVEVMAADSKYRNLALDKKASQSSIFAHGSAVKAVDGDKSNRYDKRSCMRTRREYEPWWKVDLGQEYEIYAVIVTKRADCCAYSLHGAIVRVGNSDVIANNRQCREIITAEDINSTSEVQVECLLQGQFVSVQLENEIRFLTLCEVEVMGEDIVDNLPNVALGKPAEQSSTYYSNVASRAVDGNEDPLLRRGSCMHSGRQAGAWWRVDLLNIYSVYKVVMINRECCPGRLKGAVVRVGYYSDDIDRNAQCGTQVWDEDLRNLTIVKDCFVAILGKYVFIKNDPFRVSNLHICEVKVHAREFNREESMSNMFGRIFLMFSADEGKSLPANSTDVFYDLALYKCASRCFRWKRYDCRSFDYNHRSNTCKLYRERSGSNGIELIKATDSVYYQKLRLNVFIPPDDETECPSGYIRCTSGECVHPYQICDTLADCIDKFDEFGCMQYDSNVTDHSTAFYPGWHKPYHAITDDQDVYKYFEENVHVHFDYDRVKGEDPPDWMRFKTFSSSPDYLELDKILKLSADEIGRLGHQAEDFILQCSYAGEACDPRNDFVVLQDENYGNCFQFNANLENTRLARGSGPEHGLTLTLFIEENEYFSIYGQDSAAVVSIVPPGDKPFPLDHGFFAMPGTVTTVSLTQSKVERQTQPYGNCSNEAGFDVDNRVMDKYLSKSYSLKACEKACLQTALIRYCGCTDILNIAMPPCRTLNKTQVACKQLIYYFFQSDKLHCKCAPPCSERKYSMTISQSKWPSEAYLKNLLRLIKVKSRKTQTLNDLESARANLVRLKVYFETLNYESTSENIAYTWADLLSDVGGTLGLYVGFSVITLCEVARLLLSLCAKFCRSRRKRNACVPEISGDEKARRQGKVAHVNQNALPTVQA
ncbi:uncharacterized protein [Ptychodera flava]|uniref:uncharacterized protein n=1 Tax=Ptychodera flava TaxID=63121 RepID=UPI00396A0815